MNEGAAARPPNPEPAGPSDRQEILAALDVRLHRPRTTPSFRLGLVLGAAVLVLLPLLYLALVGLTAYGVLWHATANLSMLGDGGARGGQVLGYVTPLVVGCVLVFFLVKPFLAPRPPRPAEFEVDEERQPFLHAFVRRLCAAVGAPAPSRILVDCQVNASAGFHGGGAGIMGSGRELRLGLPLVASMPLDELAGVLAHEFGHFSQGLGMRLAFVVTRIQGWFVRVAYERDGWDRHLAGWQRSGVIYLILIGWAARFFVWLTRRLLVGMVWVARVVTSYLSRQMEYDADRFQVQLVGPRTLGRALERVTLLGYADVLARQQLGESWTERRLARDLPLLVQAKYAGLPEDGRREILGALADEPAETFATHPRTVDRIAAAERLGDDGVFHVGQPASVLFDDFGALCGAVSAAHYRELLGEDFVPERHLVDNDVLLAAATREREEAEALLRVCQGAFQLMRPVPVAAVTDEPTVDADGVAACTGRLRALRDEVAAHGKAMNESARALVAAHDRIGMLSVAAWQRRHGAVDAAAYELEHTDPASIRKEKSAARKAAEAAASALDRHLVALGARIGLAVSLLGSAGVRARVEDGDALHREATVVLEAVRAVGATLVDLVEVRTTLAVLQSILAEPRGSEEELFEEITRLVGRLDDPFARAAAALGDTPYPYEHASDDSLTIARFAEVERACSAEDRVERANAAAAAESRLSSLYGRCFGTLARACEAVEDGLGLERLPMPQIDGAMTAPAEDAGRD